MADTATTRAAGAAFDASFTGGVLEHVASNVTPFKLAICGLISIAHSDSLDEDIAEGLQFFLIRQVKVKTSLSLSLSFLFSLLVGLSVVRRKD